MNTWLITGDEKTTRSPLSILYSGSEINKNYLIGLAFNDSYSELYLGKKWIWNLQRMAGAKKYDSALMVIEGQDGFRKLTSLRNSFYIPLWITGEVDCSVDIKEYLKKESLRSDIRKIGRNGLEYELTRDRVLFDDFYFTMYDPYIKKAHGGAAVVEHYELMKEEFKNCELLLIKKDGASIAGILLHFKEHEARLGHLGIKNADLSYVRDGAIAALFYHAVVCFKDRSYEKINFGMSRAFLNDGVMQYKKKWNQKVADCTDRGYIMKPVSTTPATTAFFMNNPFIFRDALKYYGAVFVRNEQPFTEKEIKKMFKKFYMPGMSRLFIGRFTDVRGKEELNVPHEIADRLTLCSADSMFSHKRVSA